MVKINLKTTPSTDATPEGKTPSRKESIPSEGQPPERENIDLSFDSMESFFPKTDEETPSPESEEGFVEEAESPPPESQTEARIHDYEDEISPFKSSIPRKKLYIIFGSLALVLLIVIFLIYKFWGKGKEEAPQPVAKGQTPVAEQEEPPAESRANILTPLLQQNLATNQFIRQQLANFISRKPASADYSLIFITPSEINLTVLADSRDQVARFHLDLKKAFPNFNFRILSVQAKYQNGKDMFYADFQAPISTVKASPSAAPTSVPFEPAQNFADGVKTLANESKVKLSYFKQGGTVEKQEYQEKYYYIQVNGKKQNILNFLAELIQRYPMIRINKFSIFPYNLETISDRNLSTRISLTFFNRK